MRAWMKCSYSFVSWDSIDASERRRTLKVCSELVFCFELVVCQRFLVSDESSSTGMTHSRARRAISLLVLCTGPCVVFNVFNGCEHYMVHASYIALHFS